MWQFRIQVIIPEADRSAANALAATIDPDWGGAQTFGDANVSAGGAYPPTHIYINTAATEAMRAAMAAAVVDWEAAGLTAMPQFWVVTVDEGLLAASNTSAAQIGEAWDVWGVQSLAAAGLQWTQWPEE